LELISMAGPLGSRVLTRILAVVAAVTMVASVPEVARAAEAAEKNRPAAARDLAPLPSEKPAERQVSEPTGDFTQSPNANGQVQSLPDGPLPANFVKKDGARVISRTPKSTTYDNGDGTSTALIHTSPVNWRDRFGTWRAIDPRLVAAPGDRLANASGPVRVSFPTATGDHDLLQVSADEWKLGFRLAGAAAGRAGKVDGAKIRYGGMLGAGVDLDAQVTPTGVKEDIVLARPLGPRRAPGSPTSSVTWCETCSALAIASAACSDQRARARPKPCGRRPRPGRRTATWWWARPTAGRRPRSWAGAWGSTSRWSAPG
jgi:hypothetical protein